MYDIYYYITVYLTVCYFLLTSNLLYWIEIVGVKLSGVTIWGVKMSRVEISGAKLRGLKCLTSVFLQKMETTSNRNY